MLSSPAGTSPCQSVRASNAMVTAKATWKTNRNMLRTLNLMPNQPVISTKISTHPIHAVPVVMI